MEKMHDYFIHVNHVRSSRVTHNLVHLMFMMCGAVGQQMDASFYILY